MLLGDYVYYMMSTAEPKLTAFKRLNLITKHRYKLVRQLVAPVHPQHGRSRVLDLLLDVRHLRPPSHLYFKLTIIFIIIQYFSLLSYESHP